MLRKRCPGGWAVGPLRGGEEEGQFLSRRVKIELQLGKIVLKRASGQSRGGRSRIRRGRAFVGLGLSVEVRRIQLPK